jgi:hypothetical protein
MFAVEEILITRCKAKARRPAGLPSSAALAAAICGGINRSHIAVTDLKYSIAEAQLRVFN